MAKTETRRKCRERAFQVLYGLNFVPAKNLKELTRSFAVTPRAPKDEDAKASDPVAEIPTWDRPAPEPQGFAWDLIQGVWSKQQELDEIVTRFSQHWRIERIAKIELTILRLALYEMIHRPDVPVKVAINEAVELAKTFGDENSRGFVNGILDAAAKAIEHGDIGIH